MSVLRQHWARIAITLVPIVLALAHAGGLWRSSFLDALENFIYDTRLRATMPRTLDPRIVIIDIDDASLQQMGQWPWRRDQLAKLVTEVIDRQQATVLGFDVLFVEPDSFSAHDVLQRLEEGAFAGQPQAVEAIRQLVPKVDPDAIFASALAGRPVALGFYFTRSKVPQARGQLPAPVLPPDSFPDGREYATRWNGFVGSIPQLAQSAPAAGFLNVLLDADQDGVVRSVPLIARYVGQVGQPGYYESLALAVFRMATDSRALMPIFAPGGGGGASPMQSLALANDGGQVRVPLDASASILVPYRGPGGANGGSFRHVPAADVIHGALAPGELKGKIVLVGSSAPGLEDLRSTPAGAAFPGVEVHANIISGLLDGRLQGVPDYAAGYESIVLVLAGLVLAFGLSLGTAQRAVVIAGLTVAVVIGINTLLFLHANLVLPLGATLAMIGVAFVLNMSWGYLVEARASRRLANLFGTYVPRELVAEMQVDPARYSMRAQSRELTVMFCDMRGFTRMAEHMAPVDLQDFLNVIFSRLTEVISAHWGTVDKYIGDCVMAFWGAPVDTPNHAERAVRAAIDMVAAVRELNEINRRTGRPQINVGIGLNSGVMSVGDMGSAIRRSYTVVGDAVNLASRIEGLGVHYGVEIVATEATQALAPSVGWQELDCVRVQGKLNLVRIFTPTAADQDALTRWNGVISAYRAQDWQRGQAMLAPLLAMDAKKVLYQLYEQRLASMALQPKDPDWDGATRFESK
ncbi:CHASE2 domain-containing protein [Variovorax sp. YR216]|uniref:CHASE2 domain-containing protein n=1 Tax=Variovorax sp. YR216 TaxID=1882828 RepID=UPI00089A03B7|nr:adenylate/guanylate cyclase domain-containing protein [Variovorax sp. YR216]SEB12191.1 adenylate cyclase [Variovorax sp. YR216]